jgi:hypothetical protein
MINAGYLRPFFASLAGMLSFSVAAFSCRSFAYERDDGVYLSFGYFGALDSNDKCVSKLLPWHLQTQIFTSFLPSFVAIS